MKRVLVATSAVMLLGGCATVHPTLEDLRSTPGATARYPGSTLLRSFDQESSHNIAAKNPARLKSDWCADGTAHDYLQWYDAQLTAAGWTSRPPVVSSSDPDIEVLGEWTRGARTFDLSSLSSAYVRRAGGTCTLGFQTKLG